MSCSEYMRNAAARRKVIFDPHIRSDAGTLVMQKRLAVSRVFAADGQPNGTLFGRPERSYPEDLGFTHPAISSKKERGRAGPASDFAAYQASKAMGQFVPTYTHNQKIELGCTGCGGVDPTTLDPNGLYRPTDAPVSARAYTSQRAALCNQVFQGPPRLVNLLTRPLTRNIYTQDSCCNEIIDHNKGSNQSIYRRPDATGTPNYLPPNYGNNISSNTDYKVGAYYNPRSRYQENHHGSTVHQREIQRPYDPTSGASGPPHLRLNQPVFNRIEA